MRTREKRIVVTTPRGHVGSRVVQLLIQAGVRPTLLMRDPARLDPAVRARVDVVQADQADAEAVVAATRGADRLFWVDPPALVDGDPVAGYARMGESAARAITENGIEATVFLSSIGAEKRGGAGEIDGLARTEELLDATGATVLHLRCAYFFTNLLTQLDEIRAGTLSTPWPLEHVMPWVDPRDIGEVAAARLLSDAWSGRVVQAVHGPEDLTFAQVAKILGAELGHDVTPVPISDEQFRGVLREAGLGAGRIDGIAGMSAGLSSGFVAEQPRSIDTTTPTTLAAWARTHLR
ncbi:NAD(P)H-binding protein [Nocardia neocaledoniensis]|uniref:NmrA family NAD(P)-binding protein n=1 Tax=Nocardia neocaledoniensis TaxID=236511 RepID=UPI0024538A2D|nr:NAD(P)H-binding protein [Nocardia neocaledoniensis]